VLGAAVAHWSLMHFVIASILGSKNPQTSVLIKVRSL
jgi:hypothetical protein